MKPSCKATKYERGLAEASAWMLDQLKGGRLDERRQWSPIVERRNPRLAGASECG